MDEKTYIDLARSIDQGEGIHPGYAAENYGFPELTTPGLQVHVVQPPDKSPRAWHEILIFQATQHSNRNRSWIRLRSLAKYLGEVPS